MSIGDYSKEAPQVAAAGFRAVRGGFLAKAGCQLRDGTVGARASCRRPSVARLTGRLFCFRPVPRDQKRLSKSPHPSPGTHPRRTRNPKSPQRAQEQIPLRVAVGPASGGVTSGHRSHPQMKKASGEAVIPMLIQSAEHWGFYGPVSLCFPMRRCP